jgi:pyruvate kinase
VPSEWLAHLRTGECVKFTDARDSRRTLKVVDVTDHGCWAEATKTAYIVPGTILHHERGAGKKDERKGRVGELLPVKTPSPCGRATCSS